MIVLIKVLFWKTKQKLCLDKITNLASRYVKNARMKRGYVIGPADFRVVVPDVQFEREWIELYDLFNYPKIPYIPNLNCLLKCNCGYYV